MRPSRPITREQALDYARGLCDRAEYSSGEVREKLRRKGVSGPDIDYIVDALIDGRYIDDSRFASAYVRSQIEYAGWGRRKIALYLYRKGVARRIIDETLAAVDMDVYLRRLAEIVKNRLGREKEPESYETRQRLYRHLVSRGFEPDAISAVLNGCDDFFD